jgi:multicomponent Na+:H+ antiporter subunit F
MTLQDIAVHVALPGLALGAVLTTVRLLRGPSLPDRVVALDLLTTLGIGMACTWAMATDAAAFLDVALVLALVAFLGTVAFARYLERQG